MALIQSVSGTPYPQFVGQPDLCSVKFLRHHLLSQCGTLWAAPRGGFIISGRGADFTASARNCAWKEAQRCTAGDTCMRIAEQQSNLLRNHTATQADRQRSVVCAGPGRRAGAPTERSDQGSGRRPSSLARSVSMGPRVRQDAHHRRQPPVRGQGKSGAHCRDAQEPVRVRALSPANHGR